MKKKVKNIFPFFRSDVSKYFPSLAGKVKITLIEASDKILGAFDERMSKYALSTLTDKGVKIQCRSAVTQITAEHIEMKVRSEPTISPEGTVIPSADSVTTVQVPYGSLVWAGGIASRPITKAIAASIGGYLSFSLFLISNSARRATHSLS